MRKILVFEHTEYSNALEKEFYWFCVRRQFSLVRYCFIYLIYSLLHLLKMISVSKYYEKRWSFLCDVDKLEDKIDYFWEMQKKRFTHLIEDEDVVWISEYPDILLNKLAELHNVELIANYYKIVERSFSNFECVPEIYKKIELDEKVQIYDKYHSKLKKMSGADFKIVDNRKIYDNSVIYWICKALYGLYTVLVLAAMGVGLALVSLYFGSSHYGTPMLHSYFNVKHLVVLNIFPVVLCIFLLYFISNNVWSSFFITSALVLVLTWINYFKLLYRDDPLYAVDLSLISEVINMSHKYSVHLNIKMICAIIVSIILTIASAFLVKGKIRSITMRVIGIIVFVYIAIYSFNNVYMDDNLYKSTENFTLINRWSSSQVYISKGFIYSFLYSFKTVGDNKPTGYNKEQAEKELYSYSYSNIPNKKKVNVISIMMESYCDLSQFKQLKFNVDVYKNLHELEAESYSGELVTNIFGGGTVDTERCFFTGYTSPLPNFRSNVNSYLRYFKEQGYTVEGSHPCYNWFYNRRNIDEYLGFQNYYFFENYYSKLANGKIAKDNILFPQVLKLFEKNKKTGKPYFSGNVTYQNHGPYSAQKLTSVKYIENKGYSQNQYNIVNNYLSGIYKTTQQIKLLIDSLRKEKEPVVVILFGDHKPELGDNNIVYKTLGIHFDFNTEEGFYNYYDTPYIIWGNDSAKKVLGNDIKGKGPKIGPYFLMNEFFNIAGYKGNEYMKFSNSVKSAVDVISSKGRYKEDGVLKWKVSSKDRNKLQDFFKVEYYWSMNFRNNPSQK